MSRFDYHGYSMYYEENGVGKPLLLLHGNTASGQMFAPVVPALAAKYHVIVPDLLGCGRSDRIAEWPADLWYEWAGQALALCKHLRLEKVNVIGCSGGALAALNMALEAPELVNAVILDSFEGLRADPGITERIRIGRDLAKQNEGFRAMLRAMHGADWESVVDADTEAIVAHAKTVGAFFHQPIENNSVRLFLTGSEEDEMFPAGHYEALFTQICRKTALAEPHIFKTGGHPAMLSNTEEFISLCDDFFQQ